ncbi:hypothetical protein Plec18167_000157 [Paecilomyces lecythidis]|uniref:Uncharacterized protein n=1 Tax=Paecilomyces lecythidis TaxID=3004212 RepID=A0ABR3YEJ2_9EURO
MVSTRVGIDRSTSSNVTNGTEAYQCRWIISDQPQQVAGSLAQRGLDKRQQAATAEGDQARAKRRNEQMGRPVSCTGAFLLEKERLWMQGTVDVLLRLQSCYLASGSVDQ